MVVPEVVLWLAGWKGGQTHLTLGLHLVLSWEGSRLLSDSGEGEKASCHGKGLPG